MIITPLEDFAQRLHKEFTLRNKLSCLRMNGDSGQTKNVRNMELTNPLRIPEF